MSETEVTGPDLTAGVPASSLSDGGMIAGRIGNDAVVLARRGEEFFAFDGFCTHYHAPLNEGAIVGDTVRCPWHHACFELRSGSPFGAPAIRSLRVFRTERDGELVRVQAEPQTQKPPHLASDVRRIVIVGAGSAGSSAAAELRRIGYDGSVTLISREDRLPYDKPNLSKDYLAGRAPKEWIPLRSEEEYAADNVELKLGVAVESLDTARGQVRLADGSSVPFDRLILATGASPRRLDIPVDPATRIHYLRTWSDSDAIIAAAENAGPAVVIGASFIALETAASLRERGVAVTVVAPEERPLERVFGRDIAAFIRSLHESHGVEFHLARKPVEVRADSVLLDDGTSLPARLVVAGVGVVPDTALAEAAGLVVENGIVVDQYLQSSAPNVYAAGDAVRYPDPRSGARIRVEHWAAAGRQGQAAARNATGRSERFSTVPFFWSQHYDLVFAYVGHAARPDRVELFGSLQDHNAAVVYREGDAVAAVCTLFRDDLSLAVEAAMERGESGDDVYAMVKGAFA